MASLTNQAMARTVASSRTYRFLVGPEKEEFFVHSPLLSQNSPVLRATISHSITENAERTIKWDDIDVRTFTSFWQFLYTGMYDDPVLSTSHLVKWSGETTTASMAARDSLADPTPNHEDVNGDATTVVAATSHVVNPPMEESVEAPHPATKKKKKKVRREPSTFWRTLSSSESFTKETLSYEFEKLTEADLLPPGASTAAASSSVSLNSSHHQDDEMENHIDIMKHHALVAILADRHDMSRLFAIAMSKLHKYLVGYELNVSGPANIVDLLRFCYLVPRPESLRQLVVLYAACHARKLWSCEGFGDLLESSGEFARVMMRYMVQRIE